MDFTDYPQSTMARIDEVVRAAYHTAFNTALQDGRAKPLLIPYSIFGAYILPTLWLTIPHTSRPWLYQTRWAVMAFVIWFNVHVMRVCSSTNFACAYAGGLMASWGIILSMNLLIWRRPQWDAARVIKVKVAKKVDSFEARKLNGTSHQNASHSAEANGMRQRKLESDVTLRDLGMRDSANGGEYQHEWQPFPSEAGFLDRLGWAMDLSSSFRGAGWNWSISSIPRPPIPAVVRAGAQLDITTIPRRTPSGYSYPSSEAELLRGRLAIVLTAYLLLDFMAIQMTNDPYFVLGPDNKYQLPDSLRNMAPGILLLRREIRAVVTMWGAIAGVFQLNDIVQYFFLKRYFPFRADLWHYASTFGGFSGILDRGLAGWWGSWWHQTFRLEFLGPATYLMGRGVITKGTPAADAVGLFVSFFHSGFMHAAGSLASVPETKPWRSMVFFLLQAVGIIIQQRLAPWMPRLPRVIRRAGNVFFCLGWLYITAPFFVDDLSSTGLWLLEPVPLSPLRLLGLGKPGDHWWRWNKEYLPKWYAAKHWWEIGIAL